MNPILRNILSLIAGCFVGGVVNMALVNLGPSVVPLPEGADISTMDGLRESMKNFAPVNFLFPFLAHALGTLAGAFVAAKLAFSHHLKYSLAVGALFLMGGISMVAVVGGPMWFIVLDLVVAYLPMGYLGGILAGGKVRQ